MIGLNKVITQLSHINKDLLSMKNFISVAKGIQKEIKEFAARYSSINKDICILVGKSLRMASIYIIDSIVMIVLFFIH